MILSSSWKKSNWYHVNIFMSCRFLIFFSFSKAEQGRSNKLCLKKTCKYLFIYQKTLALFCKKTTWRPSEKPPSCSVSREENNSAVQTSFPFSLSLDVEAPWWCSQMCEKRFTRSQHFHQTCTCSFWLVFFVPIVFSQLERHSGEQQLQNKRQLRCIFHHEQRISLNATSF